jgi:hypothetical protein
MSLNNLSSSRVVKYNTRREKERKKREKVVYSIGMM